MEYVHMLNNSKYFSGVTMLLLNLGSKYVPLDLSQNQEKFLNSAIIRRVVLFTIFFSLGGRPSCSLRLASPIFSNAQIKTNII